MRAIQLAKNGLGSTYPHPMLGCVIEKNGKIISESWFDNQKNELPIEQAINRMKDKDLLKKSTLYITLEFYFSYQNFYNGINLIIKNKLSKVIIGIKNPFYKFNNLGKELKKYGVIVIENFLKYECYHLNKRFFTFYEKKRPYIILTWSQSIDGFIFFPYGKNTLTSDKYCIELFSKWKIEENSFLIGKKNLNRKLINWNNVHSIQIFFDQKLSITNRFFLFNEKLRTIIFSEKKKNDKENVEYIQISFKKNMIEKVLKFLYQKKIQSFIINEENKIIKSFLKKNIWDECRITTFNIYLSNGILSPKVKGLMYKKININRTISICILSHDNKINFVYK